MNFTCDCAFSPRERGQTDHWCPHVRNTSKSSNAHVSATATLTGQVVQGSSHHHTPLFPCGCPPTDYFNPQSETFIEISDLRETSHYCPKTEGSLQNKTHRAAHEVGLTTTSTTHVSESRKRPRSPIAEVSSHNKRFEVSRAAIEINKKIMNAAKNQDCRAIIKTCKTNKADLNAVNISTAIHRIATICKTQRNSPDRQITEFLSEMANRVINEFIHDFKTRELANTLWAFATLGILNQSLMEACATEILHRQHDLRKFNPQDIANTLWAFGTLGILNQSLMEAFATEIRQRQHDLSQFKPQEVANTLWAFGTLGVLNQPLMEAFATEILQRKHDLSQFKPQEVANTLWAFAKLGILNQPLMEAFAKEILPRKYDLSQFNPQNISNTLWAFATLGVLNQPLMEAFATAILQRQHDLSQFNPQEVANTLWAFATLGVLNQPLMEAFATAIRQRQHDLSQFKPQNIANTLWAFATLGVLNQPLMEAFATEILHRQHDLRKFNPQDIANTLWAFAVLQMLQIIPVSNFVDTLVEDDAIRNEQLHQFLTVKQEIELFPGTFKEKIQWPKWLLDRMKTYKYNHAKTHPKTSPLETDILRDLKTILKDLKHSVLLEDFYWVDFYDEKQRLVIEVDGPSHDGNAGPDALKTRHLQTLGYRVIRINYRDWNAVKDKRVFLNKLIYSSEIMR